MTPILVVNAIVIACLMLSIWLLSLLRRDVSIVDVFWGLGFVLVAWVTWSRSASGERSWLVPVLTTVWGLRLSGYLFLRNHGKPEDYRYREMREHHGSSFWLVSLLTVFVLQGVVMWVVSLPLQLADKPPSPIVAGVGFFLWLTGFFFESVGDQQLAKFKKNPANSGKVLRTGLWRYTRHPNYFGDFCVWWGLYLTAVASGAPIWTLVGPLAMSITLLKFSGVNLLEKSLTKSKPQYQEYVETTNAFFPMPPKSVGTEQ